MEKGGDVPPFFAIALPNRGFPGLLKGVEAGCAVSFRWVSQPAFPGVFPVPSPYHRRTCAASCSDFVAKSEDALEEVRRWYGAGTAMVACSLGHEAAHLVWASGELLG